MECLRSVRGYWMVCAILLLAGCGGARTAVELPWARSLPLAMEDAAREGKDLFVFFHAPWCAVCQRMKADVFTDPSVVNALDAYIPVSVDVEAFPHLAVKYQVDAIPVVLIATSRGAERYRVVGGLEKQQLLDLISPEELETDHAALH